MADWRAVYENWNTIPEENRQLIKQLFKEKPREKLAELFKREPYAKMVYEKVIGEWQPQVQIEQKVPTALHESQRSAIREQRTEVEISEKNILESTHHVPVGNITAVFLPIMSLISLLLAEISYYDSRLTVFLDNILPYNLGFWKILLSSALALGSVSIFYILKQAKKDLVQSKDSKVTVLPRTSITASAFVSMLQETKTRSDRDAVKNLEEIQS